MIVSTITGTDGRVGAHLKLNPETVAEAAMLAFVATSKFIPAGSVDLILRTDRDDESAFELRVFLSTPAPIAKDPAAEAEARTAADNEP